MLSKLKTKKFYILAIVLIVIIFTIFTYRLHSKNNCSKTAIIPITGEIVSSSTYNDDGSVFKGNAVAIDIIAQIRKAEKDKGVKAIVFIIDSTGGDTASAEEIARAIKEINKPTVALIRTEGDSSAYWIASATGRIFALPVSNTVDIGVTISYTDNVIQNQNNGLTFHQLSYGKYKDMTNLDKPLTADEQKLIMGQINEVANVFIQEVAQNRHLPIEKVQALADGSAILGQNAIKEGLIDQIGSFADVDRYLSGVLKSNVEICIPDNETR
jgi:protease-4